MEVHVLKLGISEKALNELAQIHLAKDQLVDDLAISVTAAGVVVQGTLPLFLPVKFDTLWELSVRAGQVAAQLVRFKAWGVPGTIFKSAIVKLLADAAKQETWLRTDEDALIVNVDDLFQQNGLAVKSNLTAVRCEAGMLFVEAAKT